MMMKFVKKELGCFIVWRRGVLSFFSIFYFKKNIWIVVNMSMFNEKEMLYNKVMILYVVELVYGVGVVFEIVDEDVFMLLENEGLVLLMGWVLKLVIVIRMNVIGFQKNYFIEVF